MSKKLIVAALALALAGPIHAAGEEAAREPAKAPAKAPVKVPAKKRLTAQYAGEDILARTVFQLSLIHISEPTRPY